MSVSSLGNLERRFLAIGYPEGDVSASHTRSCEFRVRTHPAKAYKSPYRLRVGRTGETPAGNSNPLHYRELTHRPDDRRYCLHHAVLLLPLSWERWGGAQWRVAAVVGWELWLSSSTPQFGTQKAEVTILQAERILSSAGAEDQRWGSRNPAHVVCRSFT